MQVSIYINTFLRMLASVEVKLIIRSSSCAVRLHAIDGVRTSKLTWVVDENI